MTLSPLELLNTLRKGDFTVTDPRIDEMTEYLRQTLSEKRFNHSLCVANAARRLAEINGADADKCYLTGLLHDICKELPQREQLEIVLRSGFDVQSEELKAPKTHHAIAGAAFVREKYGITDPNVLTPIRWHTVGKDGMNLYEQIIYMADLISDDRDYDDFLRIRDLTYRDLKRGLYEAFKWMIQENIEKCRLIPKSTFDAYNEYTALEISRLSDRK